MNLKRALKPLIIPLKTIDRNLPSKGVIYDLGCGEGTVASFLGQKNDRQVIGIDKNRSRVSKANILNSSNNVKFQTGDLVKMKFHPRPSGIIISDVLHHLKPSDQQKLLTNIYKTLNPGGKLIIKEINKEEILRTALSRLWDFLLYPKDRIHYFKATSLIKLLKNQGYRRVSRQTAHPWMPASINLFIATK